MKPSITVALSTIVFSFSSVAIAQNMGPCKLAEGVKEVTVIDGKASLRTDPRQKGQIIPNAPGERAFINEGDKLLIIEDQQAQEADGICYYPVKVTQGNTLVRLQAQAVLDYLPYWVPRDAVEVTQYRQPKPTAIESNREAIKSSSGKKVKAAHQPTSFFFNLLPGLAILGIGGGAYFAWSKFKTKLFKDNNKKELSLLNLSTVEFYNQKQSSISNDLREAQQEITQLRSKIEQIQSQIEQNKTHIMENRELIANHQDLINHQNELIEDLLHNQPSFSIPQCFFPEPSELHHSPSAEPWSTDVLEENQPETISPDPTQNRLTENVIAEFNQFNSSWFQSRIQDGIFRKAQIPRYTLSGIDPGSTLIELSDHGVYLIFHTADKTYLIPDCTERKWRRAVTPNLFNGQGTTFIRPAELCQQDSTLWRVINPGEFTE